MKPIKDTRSPAPDRSGLVLLLLCIANFMISIDFSIVNVALSAIKTDLGFSQDGLQWIISAFPITFGGFLLLGGRFADLYGRRKLFIIGLGVFAVASLLAGLSTNASMLIIFRGLQGLASAIITPAALSLLTTSFAEGSERERALGVYGAVLSSGFVVGVIAGGVITEFLNWRWVMFINVPIALGAMLMSCVLLAESRAISRSRRLDIPGAITVTSAILTFVYALSGANTVGWFSEQTVSLILLAALLIAAFVFIEQHSADPLVPLSIFRLRTLVVANLVNILLIGAFVGMLFVLTLFLQQVLNYNALQTGFTFVVLGVTAVAGGLFAAPIAAKVGVVTTLTIGLLLQTLSILVMATLPSYGALAIILTASLFLGFGYVAAMVMINILATNGVRDEDQGLAGGLVSTSTQIGAGLGVAVLAAIASARTNSLLPKDLAATGTAISFSQSALLSGFRYSFCASTAMSAAATVLVLLTLRRSRLRTLKNKR